MLSWDEASYYVINKLSNQDADIEKIGGELQGIRKDMQAHFKEDSQNMALIKEMINASQTAQVESQNELRTLLAAISAKDRIVTAIYGALGGAAIVSVVSAGLSRLMR